MINSHLSDGEGRPLAHSAGISLGKPNEAGLSPAWPPTVLDGPGLLA